MYGSMEQSTPAAAPALGPEEVKFVRKLMATNGDDARCGSTCCVPTDEWDGTYDKMKKWANEGRIPQWVLDKAAAAAGD